MFLGFGFPVVWFFSGCTLMFDVLCEVGIIHKFYVFEICCGVVLGSWFPALGFLFCCGCLDDFTLFNLSMAWVLRGLFDLGLYVVGIPWVYEICGFRRL